MWPGHFLLWYIVRQHSRLQDLVKPKSWKAMIAAGQDPREDIFPFLGLIVNWLLHGGDQ